MLLTTFWYFFWKPKGWCQYTCLILAVRPHALRWRSQNLPVRHHKRYCHFCIFPAHVWWFYVNVIRWFPRHLHFSIWCAEPHGESCFRNANCDGFLYSECKMCRLTVSKRAFVTVSSTTAVCTTVRATDWDARPRSFLLLANDAYRSNCVRMAALQTSICFHSEVIKLPLPS